MAVKPIPEGYHSITPYLIIKGAAAAIDYYKKVFDAKERMRMDASRRHHRPRRAGDRRFRDHAGRRVPGDGAPEPEDAGRVAGLGHPLCRERGRGIQARLDAGGHQVRPVENQFYGDRMGSFEDPFGHIWSVATHVEDVAPAEMQRRAAEIAKQQV